MVLFDFIGAGYNTWRQEAEGGEQHLWRLSQVEGLDQHQEGAAVSTRVEPFGCCQAADIGLRHLEKAELKDDDAKGKFLYRKGRA